ncbi:hypothetical protein ACO0K0_16175 [Undibacterium sp. SXout11W]|uniref:sensor histidine kinase n=1 Tax=Undibacterium sp. SXout11W TaxID=3413050 RepID=UPI003BEFA1D2
MKPQKWVSLKCDFKWLIASVFFALCSTTALANQVEDVTGIRQAEFIISDSPTIPASDAKWQSVSLPHRESKPTDKELVGYWVKTHFNMKDAHQPFWLYISKLPSGGSIFVNGTQIANIPSANKSIHVRWYRSHLLFLPPSALHDGQNELSIRFAVRDPITSMGTLEVGAEQPLRTKHERFLFWEDTTADISAAICLFAGVLIIAFWLRRPQEKLYSLFGVCVLFWGLRTLLLKMPIIPMEYFFPWRITYYFTTSGFIALIVIFTLRFRDYVNVVLERILVSYWLSGCIVFSMMGMSFRPIMDSYWFPGFLPFTFYAAWRLSIYAMRQRTRSDFAMGVSIVIALVLSVHDLAVQENWLNLSEIYLMHLGIPTFLLVMASLLSDRFLDSLKQVESANQHLEIRVAAKEKELAVSYDHLRKLERSHAATEERQRIMQDMHDGVGSQLLSTLVMAQRGAASQNDMVTLLQECLDDMRLAIDSLSPNDPDLLPVLGNFRFRMESRFRAIGLNLLWRNHDMPDSLELAPHAGLQVLRILQEALANTLKHAQAKTVSVELYFSKTSLCIHVADDGIGFVVTTNTMSRGIKNMQARAQKIGASFTIRHLSSGTMICLDVPIETSNSLALVA